MLVRTLLESRRTAAVRTMESGRRLAEAVALMGGEKVSLILVTRDAVPVGALSRGDLLSALADGPMPAAMDRSVEEVMTPGLISVGPDDRIDRAVEVALNADLRWVPVIEEGRILGILSAHELFQWRLDGLRDEVGHLQTYIADLQEAAFD